jgi:alpha-methylacyl-CoA racemase
VQVVELAGLGPAELGCMMLADMGAEVIRVERLATVRAAPHTDSAGAVLARGRKSVGLNLRHPDGLAALLRLLERADVLVDPYRPGVLERLGLAPDDLLERLPSLIIARMTGWGQHGPLARAAGHDLNYIAVAGALSELGEPGRLPPVPLNLVGDFGGGGMLLLAGILAAMVERGRSGIGQVIDVAMVDGVATLLASIFQLRATGDYQDGRGVNWLQGAAPWYHPYEASDGAIVTVAALEPAFYALLLERVGLDPAEWPQWERNRWPALEAELTRIFAGRTGESWQSELEGTDACFALAPPLSEAVHHPHIAARGTYVDREGVVQPAPAPRFGRTPTALGAGPRSPGQDTVEVLESLGLDAQALIRDKAAA